MSIFVTQVNGSTAMTMTDINHAAETVLIPLFREVYGYKDLKNLNSEEEVNYPAIDLADENARVAIQITSTANSEKIKHTLEQFIKFKLYEKYDRLIVYILTDKQKSYSGEGFSQIIQGCFQFDKGQDILDYRDILAQVDAFQLDRVRAVERILEENFGDNSTSLGVQEDIFAIRVEQRQVAEEANQARTVQTEALIIAQQKATQQQTQDLGNMLEAMRRQLLEGGIQPPAVSMEETAYSAKLDVARGLLGDGQAGVARKVLLGLRSETTHLTISPAILFRIATQLGACAYELGEVDTAVLELNAALAYQPDDPTALANAASAASLVGNADEALRLSIRVRQLEQQSSVATSIYIGVLHLQGRFEEIGRIIADEPWITTDPMCLTTLGDFEVQDGEYIRAEQYLRDAISADDKNPLAYMLLAHSILVPLQRLMREDPPFPGRQEEPISARRQEAVEALTAVITLTAGRANPDMRHLALANRAGVLAALGQLDEAEQDCDKVLAENKHQDTALRNKGQILLQRGDKKRAVQFFEQIQGQDEKMGAALPLATAHNSLGQFAQVIKVLTPLWETPSHERDKIYIANMLMNAHSRLGDEDGAALIEADLLQNWPNDPDMLSVLSSRRVVEGKDVEAVALLEQGLAVAQGHIRDWVAYQLAQLYYKLGNFAKATETYKSIVDTTKDSVELREYVYSLYQTGQSHEALEIARSLRGNGAPIPMISEIEAVILEEVSDWNGAATILSQLREIEPQKLSHSVRLVRIETRRGDEDAARDAALKVPYEAIKDDPELLMRIAFARNRLGMADVLRFAYQARRIANDDSIIHAGYMQLFPELNANETAAISVGPAEVDVDCSVRLTRNGNSLAFTLIDEAVVYEADGEVNLSHPYAAKLRGLRVGDKIALQENLFGAINYEVSEILNKYVFAFQESMKRFETGQLHDPNIFVGDVTDPEFMPNLKTNLDKLRERSEAIRAAYEGNKIPLCVMADWLQRSDFEVWSTLISSRGGRVNAATCDPQEWDNQRVILATTDTLALETSALFTIQYLELGAQVSQAFSKLLVAQPTLDALNRYLDEPLDSRPHHSIWSEGDHYVHQEVSADQVAKQREFVRSVVEYIRTSTQILPAADLITMNQEIVKGLGVSAAGAIALAYGQKVPLYTDDLVLRIIAHKDQQVPGVWTQAILENLRNRDILSNDQYNAAVEKLVIGNYMIVKVDAELLKWMLERDGLEISPKMARVLETFAALFMDDAQSITIAAQIAKWMWAEPVIQQNKLSVLDAILVSLVAGRNKLQTLLKMKRELAKIMRISPLQYQGLCQSIENWEHHQSD